jgi:hypothetical protein
LGSPWGFVSLRGGFAAESKEANEHEATGGENFAWHSDALNRIPHGELVALCQTLGMHTSGRTPQELVYLLCERPSISEKEFLSEALLELLPGYKPPSVAGADPKFPQADTTHIEQKIPEADTDFGSELHKGFLKPKKTQQKKKTVFNAQREIAMRAERGQFPEYAPAHVQDDPLVGPKRHITYVEHPEASSHDYLDEDYVPSETMSEGSKDTKRQRTDAGHDEEEEVVITPDMERKMLQERARSGKQNRYCQYPTGCSRFPYYGEVWDRVPRLCLQHRHDHHLNVRHPPTKLYMGCSINGTRVHEIRNIKVVEDENDPEDNERLRKAFEFLHDCEKCGCDGAFKDVYYEFPLLTRRMNTRRYVREVWKQTIGTSEPESESSSFWNRSWDAIPIGPHYPDGTEEWRRYEENHDEDDLRTNKDVEDAEMLRSSLS